MILNNVLGFIPARGNSKGIKHKNLVRLGNKPLILWTIEVAKQSCDKIVVSSEDSQILEIATLQGVEIDIRNQNLSKDNVTATEVLLDYLKRNTKENSDKVFLLQPTSPFRSLSSMKQAIGALDVASSVLSVVKGHGINTYGTLEDKCFYTGFKAISEESPDKQRQDVQHLYRKTGAILGTHTKTLLEKLTICSGNEFALSVPLIESLEIDTEEDLSLARIIAESTYK